MYCPSVKNIKSATTLNSLWPLDIHTSQELQDWNLSICSQEQHLNASISWKDNFLERVYRFALFSRILVTPACTNNSELLVICHCCIIYFNYSWRVNADMQSVICEDKKSSARMIEFCSKKWMTVTILLLIRYSLQLFELIYFAFLFLNVAQLVYYI